jgi:hypothetical protein
VSESRHRRFPGRCGNPQKGVSEMPPRCSGSCRPGGASRPISTDPLPVLTLDEAAGIAVVFTTFWILGLHAGARLSPVRPLRDHPHHITSDEELSPPSVTGPDWKTGDGERMLLTVDRISRPVRRRLRTLLGIETFAHLARIEYVRFYGYPYEDLILSTLAGAAFWQTLRSRGGTRAITSRSRRHCNPPVHTAHRHPPYDTPSEKARDCFIPIPLAYRPPEESLHL